MSRAFKEDCKELAWREIERINAKGRLAERDRKRIDYLRDILVFGERGRYGTYSRK